MPSPNRTTWQGNLTDLVDYTQSTYAGSRGRSITVSASIKPAYAEEFAFPAGFDNTFEDTYKTLEELMRPGLGVDAAQARQEAHGARHRGRRGPDRGGRGSEPGDTQSASGNGLLAQAMVAVGLLLLLAGGWLGIGRRRHGVHQF